MTAAAARQQIHLERDAIDWVRIQRDLAAPFTPEAVEWRPQGHDHAGRFGAMHEGDAVRELGQLVRDGRAGSRGLLPDGMLG